MDNIIFGIRPVAEAIEAGRQIEKLYIRKGAHSYYTMFFTALQLYGVALM